MVDDHVRSDPAPFVTLVGLALMETLGMAAEPVTLTVADWVALPPAPLQVRTKAAVELSGPVDCEPLVASDPVHAPEPVQDVALVELH